MPNTAKLDNCPNCNASIKSNAFGSNLLLKQKDINLINFYKDQNNKAYCEKCGGKDLKELKPKAQVRLQFIKEELSKLINTIPIVTIHNPDKWHYEVIGMVTAQTSTGTGAITEFASAVSDVLGSSSGRHNMKIKKGEDLCMKELQKQAFNMGGNAIIGTDIDYAEIGSGKGILMVCMAGTAVKLENTEVLPLKTNEQLAMIQEYANKIVTFKKYL